jgi:hypothetical protein
MNEKMISQIIKKIRKLKIKKKKKKKKKKKRKKEKRRRRRYLLTRVKLVTMYEPFATKAGVDLEAYFRPENATIYP